MAIWASDPKAGALPPVCVKSGRAAEFTLSFEFMKHSQTALLLFGIFGMVASLRARGPLPITRRWRRTFIVLRVVAIAAAAIAALMTFSTGAVNETWRPGWFLFAIAMFVTYLVTHTIYAGLRPKGLVDRTPEGVVCVTLSGVHPNFVAAVEQRAAATHAGAAEPG